MGRTSEFTRSGCDVRARRPGRDRSRLPAVDRSGLGGGRSLRAALGRCATNGRGAVNLTFLRAPMGLQILTKDGSKCARNAWHNSARLVLRLVGVLGRQSKANLAERVAPRRGRSAA